jgi:hypothetical protein
VRSDEAIFLSYPRESRQETPAYAGHACEGRYQEMFIMRLDEIAGNVYINVETIY